MSDIKLFHIQSNGVAELGVSAIRVEKSLQTLFEANLETLVGIRFLASEHSTGSIHGGRIDTIGIDEDGCPVIIEYKRHSNENIINQGLFYLDWLMDHRGDFERLVHRRLGIDKAEAVDWSAPRLICIASEFTRYDEHAVKQISRNVELLRYRRFGDQILMVEVVHAPKPIRAVTLSTLFSAEPDGQAASGADPYQSQRIEYRLANASRETRGLYETARDYLVTLGEDVQMKELKCYIAFKRIKNFACVEVHPKAKIVTAYLKVDPATVDLQPGFTRDVRNIGHFGTGELEVSMKSMEDFSKAKPLMQVAYRRSWGAFISGCDWREESSARYVAV